LASCTDGDVERGLAASLRDPSGPAHDLRQSMATFALRQDVDLKTI